MTLEDPIPTNTWKPTLEERVRRLEAALARLATEVSLDYEELKTGRDDPPRVSTEAIIEQMLYPEHFSTARYREA